MGKFERMVEASTVPGGRPKIPAFRTRMSRCPYAVLMNSKAAFIESSEVMSSWSGITVPRTLGVDCRSLAAEAPRDKEREPRRMWYFAEWRSRFLAVSYPIPRLAPGVVRFVVEIMSVLYR